MSRLNLQLNNFMEIYNRLYKIFKNKESIINISKYLDYDTGMIAIYFEFTDKNFNKWFTYDIGCFSLLSDSYNIYDKIRNTVNFIIYNINKN